MINSDCGTLSYVHLGLFVSDGAWTHPAVTNFTHQIIYITDGEAFIKEGDKEYHLKKDNVLYLSPGEFHTGFRPSDSKVSFYWLHFSGDYSPKGKLLNIDGDFYEMKSMLKSLIHKANTPRYSQIVKDALTMLIVEEFDRLCSKIEENSHAQITVIREYVRINCNKGITVSSVASHFNYNENYLSKLFRKHYGEGLKEYICSQKLKFAKDKLINSDIRVKEIASLLHYDDEKLFIKFFTYHEKISPSKYRKLYYNTHINNR